MRIGGAIEILPLKNAARDSERISWSLPAGGDNGARSKPEQQQNRDSPLKSFHTHPQNSDLLYIHYKLVPSRNCITIFGAVHFLSDRIGSIADFLYVS
jgi:hypothetical protein